MRTDAQPPTDGIYRLRNPQVSPLYQCVRRHSDELAAVGLVRRPAAASEHDRDFAHPASFVSGTMFQYR